VSKRLVLITAAAGALSFVGAFATGWFSKPAAVMGSPSTTQTSADGQGQPVGGASPQILTPSMTSADNNGNTLALTEEQLKELIYEVREKIQEYNTKLESLEKEKERFRIAQQTLKKDIETLNNLRVDLDSTVANLKSERDTLLKARIEIDQVERDNLLAIAAAYDKMDAARAGEILTSMAKGQSQNGGSHATNIDDAVKILYFMQERSKAKVLAELVTTEPALAALLCQKLKLVSGGN
jgi:predicted RNase H-like nuclease (RuvC/YqgF family)